MKSQFEADCTALNEALVAAESFFAGNCDCAAAVKLGELGSLHWRKDRLMFIPALEPRRPVSIHDAPLGARAAAALALERLFAASKDEARGLPEFVVTATEAAEAFLKRHRGP